MRIYVFTALPVNFMFIFLSSGGLVKIKLRLTTLPRYRVVCQFNLQLHGISMKAPQGTRRFRPITPHLVHLERSLFRGAIANRTKFCWGKDREIYKFSCVP